MKRPCSLDLCVCPSQDSPITNISAEAPDPLLFWGQIWNPYNPFKIPPLGNGLYVKVDCGPVNDLISQYDPIVYAQTQMWANLQALAAQLGCPFPQTGDLTYSNDEQTATVYCPDGSAFSYTVAAGTLTASFSDAELGEAFMMYANAWAAAYAYQQASALMDCVTREDQPPDEMPGSTPPTPGGPGPHLPLMLWLCLGETLDDSFSTYTISGMSGLNYTFAITDGALPDGVTLTQTGPHVAVLSGTPTTAGIYTWELTATSDTLPQLTIVVNDFMAVFGLTNGTLPDGDTGIDYSEQLQADGGTAPYTFALDVGSSLPDGLSLASNGTISGTPTTDGDYTFDVTVTDTNGGECTQQCSIYIEVGLLDQFKICNWSDVLALLSSPATPCSASANPPWDGIFTHKTIWWRPQNWPFYYFISQSIGGSACAADDAVSGNPLIDYPSGTWSDDWNCTSLAWNPMTHCWQLQIRCTSLGFLDWFGWIGYSDTSDVNDPTGLYTASLGNPATIVIKRVSEPCCKASLGSPPIAYTTNPYSYTVVPGYGTSPYTFDALNLPTGLSIHPNTGIVSGTPTVSGTYNSLISIKDSFGDTSDCYLTFTVNDCAVCCGSQTCLAAFSWTENAAPYGVGGGITGSTGGGAGSYHITTGGPGQLYSGYGVTVHVDFCLEVGATVAVSGNYTAYGTHTHEWSFHAYCEIGGDLFAAGVPQFTSGPANYSGSPSGGIALAAGNHVLTIGAYCLNDDPAAGGSWLDFDFAVTIT